MSPKNPINTTHSRDAALRQLGRFNRGLIAGSIALTAVLTDVAANAFPGKTTSHRAAAKATTAARGHPHLHRLGSTTQALDPARTVAELLRIGAGDP